MNKSRVRKFVALGLLALPLIIVAALALAWGQSGSDTPTAQAAGTGGMALDVKTGAKTCIDPLQPPGDVCVEAGTAFTLSVEVTAVPAGGYKAWQTWIDYDGLIYSKKGADTPAYLGEEFTAPPAMACTIPGRFQTVVNNVNHGCANFIAVKSNFAGNILELNMACPAGDAKRLVSLLPQGDPVAGTSGAAFVDMANKQIAASDTLTIHCQVPPPTNTPTQTRTPTPTFTLTPTNTAVSQPPFVKSPALQNLWLTRQGEKIPPVQCIGPQGGDDAATFKMGLGVPIAALDPKGVDTDGDKIPDLFQPVDLGAFEFEVNYDANKVCVDINKAQAAQTMTCFIEDSVSKPTLEGVARIGCVTIGKKINIDGVWNAELSAGVAGSATCTLVIQEAPMGIATFPYPVKSAVVASGPVSGAPNCVGVTPIFGFVAPPLLPQLGYNNQTGALSAIIPCTAEALAMQLCTANGNVLGSFNAKGDTFTGTFAINAGKAIVPPVGLAIIGTFTMELKTRFALQLATVTVKPQPDVYSQAKANQDNGVVVQLTNKKCELADDQGHPIASFSCDDADVTIRYLEGDVEPDCAINALDTQAIAFRWGSEKGSLIYNDRMNLEPSGAQADADIDIKDLQFVYGRYGASCAVPHPPQPPVNQKN